MARITKDPYNVLEYHPDFYAYEGTAKKLPDVRGEYERLQKIAERRIRNFERSGLTDTDIYKSAKYLFGERAEPENMAAAIPDLAHFLTSQESTVTGWRKVRAQRIRTLRDEGLTFVSSKNFEQFADFMEYARSAHIADLFYKSQKDPKTMETGEKRLDVKALKQLFKEWQEG